MTGIQLSNLRFRYGAGPWILDGISVSVPEPQIVAIAGPNGAGKSTLLDLVAGLRMPQQGSCQVMGLDSSRASRREFACAAAHVPQLIPAAVPFTVEEVILTGRVPHGRGLYETAEDRQALEEAISWTHLESLRHRPFAALSGGERQRALVAAALCQRSPVLLLDEPGAHLDPKHESQLWALLRDQRERGRWILVVTHHLPLAAHYADRIWLLDRGRLAADAPPCDALHPERLQAVFEVPFHWHRSDDGRIFLTYGQ